ncbi:MAG: hypothetical protein ACRDLZ_06355 [Gaiellaceae bacterium]
MKRVTIGLAAVAFALVAAGPANAHVFTIHGDWKIGSFEIKRDGTLGGAVEAFGRPDSRKRHGVSCTVRWERHALKMVFYNLGGENPCRKESGLFSNARAAGPHWKTNRGLEIGDSQRRLRSLYPNARFRSGLESVLPARCWLVTRRSQLGTGGRYPGLLAKLLGERVSQFQVRYPAGGD